MRAGVPDSEEYLSYEMDERQIFFLFLGIDFPHFWRGSETTQLTKWVSGTLLQRKGAGT